MRTLKSILVLGLALSTFTATEAAKLTFKVTNPNEKVKVRLTFSQSGEQKTNETKFCRRHCQNTFNSKNNGKLRG